MKFKIGKFVSGINDWLRYYVVTLKPNEKYLRKDGTIQDSTGLAPYSVLHLSEDTPDSGNFPTIKDAIKAIESVGGTYEISNSVCADIYEIIRNIPDEKLAKILIEIEESCGPL